ncbi:hypothetical protein NDU88_010848 [Pleurodeles waltl]|uniref:Uncharacterized protein n=1 Tax=Pleurodeles waltl TaxID=8319 RepID=A0AAV7S0T5_PLEWA|nr:hypothetical protein NDU88_010848 [Pleurodeles waltl]
MRGSGLGLTAAGGPLSAPERPPERPRLRPRRRRVRAQDRHLEMTTLSVDHRHHTSLPQHVAHQPTHPSTSIPAHTALYVWDLWYRLLHCASGTSAVVEHEEYKLALTTPRLLTAPG